MQPPCGPFETHPSHAHMERIPAANNGDRSESNAEQAWLLANIDPILLNLSTDGVRSESNSEERSLPSNIDPSLRPRPQILTLPTTSSAATNSLSHKYGNVLLPSQSIITNSFTTQQDAHGGATKPNRPQEEEPLRTYCTSVRGDDMPNPHQLAYSANIFWEKTAVYYQPTPMQHPFPPTIPVAGPSNHTALVHMSPSQNTLPQGQLPGGSHAAYAHATSATQNADDSDGESKGSPTTVRKIRCCILLRRKEGDFFAFTEKCNVLLPHDQKFLEEHFQMHMDQKELAFNLDHCPFQNHKDEEEREPKRDNCPLPKQQNKPCTSKHKDKTISDGENGIRVYARHVFTQHYPGAPRHHCPTCNKTISRKDSVRLCTCGAEKAKKRTAKKRSSGSAPTPGHDATSTRVGEEYSPAVNEEGTVHVWGAESQNAGQSSCSQDGPRRKKPRLQ